VISIIWSVTTVPGKVLFDYGELTNSLSPGVFSTISLILNKFFLFFIFFSVKSLVIHSMNALVLSFKGQKTNHVSSKRLSSFKLLSRTMIPRRTSVLVVPSSWRGFPNPRWKFVYLVMLLIATRLMLTKSHAWMLRPWRNSTRTRNLSRNWVSRETLKNTRPKFNSVETYFKIHKLCCQDCFV